MKHPEKNLNEIEEIKKKYDEKLDVLIKEFEKEVGIAKYSGGLHVKGIRRWQSIDNIFYQIELEL